jgi:hypothetical protein
LKNVLIGQLNGFAMATCKLVSFAVFSIAIDRPHRVNHVLRFHAPAGGDYRFARRQASNLAHDLFALGKYRWPAGMVNGAIDTTSA